MTHESHSFDVVIVGAGPAGSSLGTRLAQAGFSVALLDARSFPRSKPCGDAISPGATPLLQELGAWDPLLRETGQAALLEGWRIRSHGGAWTEAGFTRTAMDTPPAGLAVDRRILDAVLLERARTAGAKIFERTRVFARHGGDRRCDAVVARGPRGEASIYRARMFVGADGLRSRMARLFGPMRCGRNPRLAFVSRYVGVETAGPWGELRLSEEGVLGYAPIASNACNLTLVVPMSSAARIAGDVAGFVRRRIDRYEANPLIAGGQLLRDVEVTGPFEIAPTRRTVPGGLLVGDAAGYFDPLTGQGIHRALYGAKLAARTIEASLTHPEAESEALRAYEQALDAWLGPSRRLQRMIDGVVSRRSLMEPATRILRGRAALASRLVDATGDRLPAGDVLQPTRWLAALASRAPRVEIERPYDAHA